MKGFTIIELLIVFAVVALLFVASAPLYGNLQVSAQLNETTALVVQAIRIARQNSIARVNNSSYGVKFLASSFVLYQGFFYDTRDADYDRIYDFSSALNLSSTLTNDEINFSKGLGMPSGTGVITLTHGASGQRTVSVNELGVAEEE